MHKVTLRIVLILGALAVPLMAFAAAPGNVTGIVAQLKNGQLGIHWDALDGDVVAYRIYFGQKSILQNDGAYDDFVTTNGKNTDFIMTNIPAYPQMFLSVLAVNGAGEESASFVEEVQLDLGNPAAVGQKSSQEVRSPSRKKREDTTVGLISALATTPQTIVLTFSAPVQVPVDKATQAFTVIDNQGGVLMLRRIAIRGNIVTLTTAAQIGGRRYAARVNDVVIGHSAAGDALSVDSTRNIAIFTGLGGGTPDQPAPATTPPPVASVVPVTPAPTGESRGLPSSGLPILAVMVAGGAIAGWVKFRRLPLKKR